ncbi:MAG: chromosome segregation protein SMC, partial [Eubacteriales bacterium]|nr:chromosome segregation protein SMC [Eubacteriales bacterium]
MYLKSLDIQGFKSFAEKVSLGFGSGITSIVGPNGSGKSNIADAVRWVLGEQSAKTLRGSKMEDVIFSGTEHRKPLGFSEVSLTIDNSDAKLPLEYNEVTVTRRVFRSGESEFFINKSQCRLKDIQELFMDTGIGKDGYSVISQGRVDDILSNRSEDRRNIFEEASGIMKYKTRKIQAERKLESTKQNLLRINDIINELQLQLEPLREQSETARKYLDLREMLKEVEINLYIMSISKYKEKLSEYDSQINTVKDNISEENIALEKIKAGTREKTTELSSLEEQLERAREQFYDLESSIEKCESEIKVNNEKINSLLTGIGRSDEEITETRGKLDEISQENEKKQQKLNYLNGELEKYTAKLKKYESDMEDLLSTLGAAERAAEKMNVESDEKNELLSDIKLRINSATIQIESLDRRAKEIEADIYKSKLEAERERMQREDLTELLKKTAKRIKEISLSLEELNKSKGEDETNLSSMRTRQNNLRSDLQVKQQRIQMLEEMESRMEGYSRSVKSILAMSGSGDDQAKGIYGALAQIIEVEKHYETALEMVLGGALQNIITDNENSAKRAIEYLKSNRLGRATFLPVSAVKSRHLDENTLSRLKKESGFINTAAELVACDSKFKGIISNLLGTTAVVDTIDSGIKIAKAFSYKFRIVTLEGEVINTSGAMTGGSTENNATGILGRKREIETLKTELVYSKNEYSRITGETEILVKKIFSVNKTIEETSAELKNNELIKIRDESHAASFDDN